MPEQLQRRVSYLGQFVRWACALALRGPRWLPVGVRRIPLKTAVALMRVHVLWWRLIHG